MLKASRRFQPLIPAPRRPAEGLTLNASLVALLLTAVTPTLAVGGQAQVAVPRVEISITARAPSVVVGGNFVFDTFTDTEGTALQDHTGEVGATWTKFAADPGPDVVVSDAGRIYPSSAADSTTYSASGVPPSPDYTVQADFVAVDTTNTVPSIWGRFDPDAGVLTGYRLFYSIADSGWRLDRVSSAGTTQIGSTFSDTISTGNQRAAKLEMIGSSIKATIDGVERISGTNADLSAAGRAAFRFNGVGSNTTGIHLDNFQAAAVTNAITLNAPRVALSVTARAPAVAAGAVALVVPRVSLLLTVTAPAVLAGHTFVSDSFTGTAGTTLQSHTGEQGANWTRYGPANNLVISDAGRLRGNNASSAEEAIYHASGVPPTPDYEVSATFRFVSTDITNPAILARMDTGAGSLTCYRVVYNNGAGGWQLTKFLAGANTQIGSTFADAPTAGQERRVRLRLEGTRLQVFVDGTLRIDATDAGLSAKGAVGVRFNGLGSNAAGQHLDDLTAQTLPAGAALAVPRVDLLLTVRTPPVVADAVSLPVSPVSLALTARAPGVEGGTQLLAPRVSLSLAARDPALAAGAVALAVPRVPLDLTARAPAVAPGAVTLAVPRVALQLAARDPALAPGSVLVPFPHVSLQLGTFDPAVQAGAVSLAPPRVELALTARTPAVGAGAVLAAERVALQLTARAPAVTAGGVSLAVPRVSLSLAAREPAVAPAALVAAVPRVELRLTARPPGLTAPAATVPIPRVTLRIEVRTPTVQQGEAPQGLAVPRVALALTVVPPSLAGAGGVSIAGPRVGLLLTARTPLLTTPATIGRNARGTLVLRGKPRGTLELVEV